MGEKEGTLMQLSETGHSAEDLADRVFEVALGTFDVFAI